MMPEQHSTEWTLGTLKALIDERFLALETALKLQAAEYERRLAALNHAHEKAIEVQHTYVTQDKYEDKLEAEEMARNAALLRIDEKFSDYVKRYEVRQREIDQAMAISKGAAEQAQRMMVEQARKFNRNIAVMGLALALLVALANWWGSRG